MPGVREQGALCGASRGSLGVGAPSRMLFATHALGSRVELAIDGRASPGLRAVGESAIDVVHEWHDRLSLFASDSLLGFINREAHRRAVVLDEDVYGLLALCAQVYALSGGAFDPTARAGGCEDGSSGSPMGFGWGASVELDASRRTVRLLHKGVRLDLGGVGKGFALDRAAEVLAEHGVESAFLHAGTSGMVALGPRAHVIGVRSACGVHAVRLAGGSLCVSSPRGRVFADGSSHIVDPRGGSGAGCCCLEGEGCGCAGGRPAADTAAVCGVSCAEADAWATALVVLGERPSSMPGGLGSAVHDARVGWCAHGLELSELLVEC